MRKRKKKVYLNIFFNIIAYISIAITLIFCMQIFKLNMIPTKYLSIILGIIGFIYIILILLTFPRKIRTKIKIISCIFFMIFGIIFGFGIKYIGTTASFINAINDGLSQKEDYYLMTLSSSSVSKFSELKNKDVGVYLTSTTHNTEKAVEKLNDKVSVNSVEFSDIVTMFEELSDKKIDAVLINDSIRSLLSSDLEYMNLELKEIETISVPIEESDIVKVVDVTNTPFNIYVAGGDAYGSINKVTNTDVNMVISVDPVNRKILLTSIPRDYYVNLPTKGENAYDKLTHAGYYGISESVKAVETLLDIDINYYVKVNFSTIEGVIDAIGGIDVYSDYSFKEDAYRLYTFKKGINHMNGKQALAFARERHAFSDGDVQRVKNQQKVLEAIINKVTTSTTLITNYSNILNSVSNSISMNIDTKSISRLVKMQLNDMRGFSIEKQNLTGSGANITGTYTFPTIKLYVMKRNEESLANASNKIKTFLGEKVNESETVS